MARPKQRKPAVPAPSGPLPPFRSIPSALEPFAPCLSKSHIYIAHVDTFPASFKRKIFLVPVAMNVGIVALCVWWWLKVQGPWYLSLLASFSGVRNETTVVAEEESPSTLVKVVFARGLWFLLDMTLFIFVWPWPLEFFLGTGGSASPTAWRRTVGFREREIVVRQSREWDRKILKTGNIGGSKAGEPLDFLKKEGDGSLARGELLNRLRIATSPRLVKEKTGYLTMDGDWDLAWDAMIAAHSLVDKKEITIEAFTLVALVHHDVYGWLVIDLEGSTVGGNMLQEQRRNDIFRFREALVSVGKEDLFYRWIEIVQFESTRPEGFGKERQEDVAQQIRTMFSEQGIDFDEFWKEAVGKDAAEGL
ncbi:hypothetical protein MKZ38_006717 [Zalerion maritima]|uniref:Uncharacterized protein n=1 Tax=Zalerion maritima TaxID=339359 RepID=A0AAD5WNC0_9PEZI|nr:hypothetical protein MKZ38_006717 [Zalerion maritima]